MSRDSALVSVVVPVLDEEHNLSALHARITATLEGVRFEIVFVDDGSTDGTPEVLARLAAGDPRVTVVRLSRNFGHQSALTAGLDHARGDVVAMMDADLQDPPEVLLEMLECWREGADVVYAVRTDRAGETRWKIATAHLFYRLLGRLANTELHGDAGDFRLLDRRALTALLSMRERNRYLRGMTAWVGFTQAAVPYRRDARASGTTKYPIRKMLRFGLDAIASFSHVPLQAATVIGLCTAAFAFFLLPVEFIWYLAGGKAVPGITSTIIVVAFLGGTQLVALGIIGEYVGRIYDELKLRPLYVVAETAESEERLSGVPSLEEPPGLREPRRDDGGLSPWEGF